MEWGFGIRPWSFWCSFSLQKDTLPCLVLDETSFELDAVSFKPSHYTDTFCAPMSTHIPANPLPF